MRIRYHVAVDNRLQRSVVELEGRASELEHAFITRASLLTDWLVERGINSVDDLHCIDVRPAEDMPGATPVLKVLNWFIAGNPIIMERRTNLGALGVGCMTFIRPLVP